TGEAVAEYIEEVGDFVETTPQWGGVFIAGGPDEQGVACVCVKTIGRNRHKESLLEAFAKAFHCTLRELDAVIELWLHQRPDEPEGEGPAPATPRSVEDVAMHNDASGTVTPPAADVPMAEAIAEADKTQPPSVGNAQDLLLLLRDPAVLRGLEAMAAAAREPVAATPVSHSHDGRSEVEDISMTFEGSELDANSIAGRQPTAGTAEGQDDEVPTQVGDISDISMTFETSALYNRVDAHGADLLVNVVSLATYEGATPVTAEGVGALRKALQAGNKTRERGGVVRKRRKCVVTVIAWTELMEEKDDRNPDIFTMRPGRDETNPDSVCVKRVAERLKRLDDFTLLFFDMTNEEWQECREGERIWFDASLASIFVRVLGVERCARFGYYLEQASTHLFGAREVPDNMGAMAHAENTTFIAGTGVRVVRTLAWLEMDEEPEVFPIRLDFDDRVLVSDIQKACSDTSMGLFSWDHATTQWTFHAPEASIRVFKFHSALLVKAPDVGTCIYAGREIRRLQHEAFVVTRCVSAAQEANTGDMISSTEYLVVQPDNDDMNVIESVGLFSKDATMQAEERRRVTRGLRDWKAPMW
ncbi:hypothetical protein OH76DRAFT_1423879, partial [Lentinus brumalis]